MTSLPASLTRSELQSTLSEVERELEIRRSQTQLERYAPYPKQRDFHTSGAHYRERLLKAANQVGKTYCAGAEVAMHLTGLYPEWWTGRRFKKAVHWAAASETGLLTRDGMQRILLGWPASPLGTGVIPKDTIRQAVAGRGVSDAYDYVRVAHVSGGDSILYLRSYDQGRERIQAMTLDGFWLDEEPDEDYYYECLTRTNIALGPVMLTFTPLKGMTAVVKRYLTERAPGTHVTNMTIDDAEHIDAEKRKAIIASYPAHEREARTMGVPSVGSGRVFPVTEESIRWESHAIPKHWARIVGIDFGWDHPTAAAWLAWDRDADTVYVTDCYRAKEQPVAIHAAAIKARGGWPVAWPHDGLQHDKGSGVALAEQYRKLGLDMLPERAQFEDGSNGVEAGVSLMLDMMLEGRLKVASHLGDVFEELRMYHRDNGKIVKVDEDLLSAIRYGLMMLRYAKAKETLVRHDPDDLASYARLNGFGGGDHAWLGR